MRGCLLALALTMSSTSAIAMTCAPPNFFSENSAPVILHGEVIDVKLGGHVEGMYSGLAGDVGRLLAGERPKANSARIRVTSLLRGNAEGIVEVAAPLKTELSPKYNSSELRFKEGPILLAAWRDKSGNLHTGGGPCPNGPGADIVSRLEGLADQVAVIGNPAKPESLSFEDALRIDELLKAAWDGERRVVLWEHFVSTGPSAAKRTKLAEALVMARRYEEARKEALQAIDAGSEAARSALALAQVRLGEQADYAFLPIAGHSFDKLDLSGSNLPGKDASGATIRSLIAASSSLQGANLSSSTINSAVLDGADLTNANLTDVWIIGSLEGTSLRGAVLDRSRISANSGGADLTSASGKDTEFTGDFSGTSFNDVSLTGATFRNVKLDRTSFDGAVLDKIRFENVSLKGADLSKSGLIASNVTNFFSIGVTYDCLTKFPDGFNPLAGGFRLEDATCPKPSAR